jgi:hypothetical protein
MSTPTIEGTVAEGVSSLLSLSPIVTELVLTIICLLWFIKFLLTDAREERKLNREALNNSTAVIAELKEMIRGAINAK